VTDRHGQAGLDVAAMRPASAGPASEAAENVAAGEGVGARDAPAVGNVGQARGPAAGQGRARKPASTATPTTTATGTAPSATVMTASPAA